MLFWEGGWPKLVHNQNKDANGECSGFCSMSISEVNRHPLLGKLVNYLTDYDGLGLR